MDFTVEAKWMDKFSLQLNLGTNGFACLLKHGVHRVNRKYRHTMLNFKWLKLEK